MSQKSTLKILKDSDGKHYNFDHVAFNKIVTQQTGKKKAFKTKQALCETIADECSLSVEAIKKWLYGRNGIGSIEQAKKVAEVLHIDYHDILFPLDDPQEAKEQYMDDRSIINRIYSDCVCLLYKTADYYALEKKERVKQTCFSQELKTLFKNIHMRVDQNCLAISEYTRYTLHRILIDFESLLLQKMAYIPDNLDAHFKSLSNMELELLYCTDRNDYLSKDTDPGDSYVYLLDEINLAENLGFDDIVYPTDDDWNNFDQHINRTNLGFYGDTDTEFEITPNLLWLDLLISELKNVFEYFFSKN